MRCPICNGELGFLGELEGLSWYRCRDCGFNCSEAVAEDSEPEEEELDPEERYRDSCAICHSDSCDC